MLNILHTFANKKCKHAHKCMCNEEATKMGVPFLHNYWPLYQTAYIEFTVTYFVFLVCKNWPLSHTCPLIVTPTPE